MQTTPTYALPYVEPADAIADYPAISEQLADTLEAKIAETRALADVYVSHSSK